MIWTSIWFEKAIFIKLFCFLKIFSFFDFFVAVWEISRFSGFSESSKSSSFKSSSSESFLCLIESHSLLSKFELENDSNWEFCCCLEEIKVSIIKGKNNSFGIFVDEDSAVKNELLLFVVVVGRRLFKSFKFFNKVVKSNEALMLS